MHLQRLDDFVLYHIAIKSEKTDMNLAKMTEKQLQLSSP